MELSHPLLRVPFEQANRSFRLYHKQLTKELATVTQSLAHLHEEQQPAQRMDIDALVHKLDDVTSKLQRLKHDAKIKATEQQHNLDLCLRRAHYVSELAAAAPLFDPTKTAATAVDDDAKRSVQSDVSNRLIADYLLSRGHLASAAIIESTKRIDYLVDHDLHAECQRIVQDLRDHSTGAALAWCALNGSRLRRLHSRLEFRLRVQEFIEFVRARKALEAIQYAQLCLTPLALQRDDAAVQRADLAEIEVAMGTLAFADPEASGQAQYDALFAPARWSQLVDDFQTTFAQVYGLHNPSSLCIALYTGLSTLNTRTCQRQRDDRAKLAHTRSRQDSESEGEYSCCQQSDDGAERQSKKTKRVSVDGASQDSAGSDAAIATKRSDCVTLGADADVPICPSCSDVGATLCSGLPFAYHPHSRLVCRVTHRVMDEHNPPRVLPNGHVYSQDGIDELLKRTERSGMIRCVETQELFAVSEIKPVYIL